MFHEKKNFFLPVPEFINKGDEKEAIAVEEGADAELPCPIKTDPSYRLTVRWKKDNATFELVGHVRMKIKVNKYLQIKRTQKEDAGHYTCTAENTCGGKNSLNMQLFVESK